MIEGFGYVWIVFAFVLGAAVGSWLNVCIYRIPYEKSILWPGSRCGHCFQPVRWYDNIPLVSYWVLRGRCRSCKSSFSIRYFLLELLTGSLFAGVFALDLVAYAGEFQPRDWQHLSAVAGVVPMRVWLLWACHCTLISLLIVTSMCDLDHLEIPLPVTIFGTLLGLVLAAAVPWPWPERGNTTPILLFHPWPLWHTNELPAWLSSGWKLGLATGIAGVLAGMLMLRAVRFIFGVGRGVEGLGVGDADLMMMAGAFLGWQPILIAFFISVFPALILGVLQVLIRGNQMMPFGPSLALGTLVTLFGWHWIGEYVRPMFFESTVLLLLAGAGAVSLLIISFLLRLTRGPMDTSEAAEDTSEVKQP